jgi:glycosyltransferase involved in cell wall biosynthesis
MKPKVTVYITNHNYGGYLEQAIQSVLNQSMQDFELIIIDDGSTDESLKIISRHETICYFTGK